MLAVCELYHNRDHCTALTYCSGDTVRSVFRSTLYLFGEQPFAVGDWLDIDGEVWWVLPESSLYACPSRWFHLQG